MKYFHMYIWIKLSPQNKSVPSVQGTPLGFIIKSSHQPLAISIYNVFTLRMLYKWNHIYTGWILAFFTHDDDLEINPSS